MAVREKLTQRLAIVAVAVALVTIAVVTLKFRSNIVGSEIIRNDSSEISDVQVGTHPAQIGSENSKSLSQSKSAVQFQRSRTADIPLESPSPTKDPQALERLARVEAWLKGAFSPRWTSQWFGICPDGWDDAEPCGEFGHIVRRISQSGDARDEAWSQYMEQELAAIANETVGIRDAPWYRVTCNAQGCILAVAGIQDDVPGATSLKRALERQAWIQQFESILLAGCINCEDVATYILVLRRSDQLSEIGL